MDASMFQRAKGLAFITSAFILVYVMGAIFLVASLLGVQSLAPSVWQRGSMPLYIPVFLLGAAGGLGLLRGKRWGVYGLVGSWVLTGLLNLLFPVETTASYRGLNVGLWLVVGFFLALQPVWRELE